MYKLKKMWDPYTHSCRFIHVCCHVNLILERRVQSVYIIIQLWEKQKEDTRK